MSYKTKYVKQPVIRHVCLFNYTFHFPTTQLLFFFKHLCLFIFWCGGGEVFCWHLSFSTTLLPSTLEKKMIPRFRKYLVCLHTYIFIFLICFQIPFLFFFFPLHSFLFIYFCMQHCFLNFLLPFIPPSPRAVSVMNKIGSFGSHPSTPFSSPRWGSL